MQILRLYKRRAIGVQFSAYSVHASSHAAVSGCIRAASSNGVSTREIRICAVRPQVVVQLVRGSVGQHIKKGFNSHLDRG